MSCSHWSAERRRRLRVRATGIDLNGIAELFLVTGPLSRADTEARHALKMVSQTADLFWTVVVLTTIAQPCHLRNEVEQADAAFRTAESLHL
jgi:hypothetical protein